ncbi:sulfur carrier protein ThiS [Candidatus Albibeggiatoa sp. nov. NOAA]|uniref:sulfur carrier protein ThiS n=1 Tax=Candidatus Albibeggiatoa sp. nov. NOAA TaxID=3162724 RepID=UPI0032F321B0|nr:sulfur carrier protein ThiS [Thiotrichaceae bacterium]
MDIQLNGEPKQIIEQATVQDLLADLGLTQKRLAVEVNQEIVPRSQFEQHILNPNDKVEIVHAIGGG